MWPWGEFVGSPTSGKIVALHLKDPDQETTKGGLFGSHMYNQFMKCTSVYQRFINTHPDQSCTCSKSSARREAGSVPDCHSQKRKCCVCLSCWRLSLSQQNKDSLTSDGQLTKRWTDLLLLDALTYQASVSSEEGVSHLLLFTDRLPLHLHPEVLIPAHAEGLLKQVNSSRF